MSALDSLSKIEHIQRAAVLCLGAFVGTVSLPAQASVASQGTTATGSAASVTLRDGTTLTGRLWPLSVEPVLTVESCDASGRRALERVSCTLVKDVTLIDAPSHENVAPRALTLPLEATVTFTTGGATLHGILQPSGPGWIAILPEAQEQIVWIPAVQIARMKLSESMGKSSPASVPTSATNRGGPAPMTVTLVDGTTLRGHVAFDAIAQTLTVAGATADGKRVVDYVSIALVHTVAPLAADGTAGGEVSDPAAPAAFTADVRRVDGTITTGQWHRSPAPGFFALLEAGATHPMLVPLNCLTRITLTAANAPASGAP